MYKKEGFLATVEVIDDVFIEMESTDIIEALKANAEYQKCLQRQEDITMNNPRLCMLLIDEEAVALSKDDTKELLTYMETEQRKEELFHKELYRHAQDKVIRQFARALNL